MGKLWIKTPYPYDEKGQGSWHQCTTWYEMKVLWKQHNKQRNGLPTRKQQDKPKENEG